MKFKRIISGLLAAALMAGFVFMPAPFGGMLSVSAEEIFGYFRYELDLEGNATITGYSGSEKVLDIPGVLGGHKVTGIGVEAFYFNGGLTSITIPDSVASIGRNAFSGCSSLTSITIPDSVTSIGRSAFSNCSSLTDIAIPGGVTSIGTEVFYGCARLTNITIPNSVTSIEDRAFEGCTSLTDIVIPGGVTSIGSSAFYNCDSLTSITIPDSVTSIGSSAFSRCISLKNVTIPNSLTLIGESTLSFCTSLESITIPDSVTEIESEAFYGCSSLASIIIPESVTRIGEKAFEDCTNLTIYGVPGSYAETYANENNIPFKLISELPGEKEEVISGKIEIAGGDSGAPVTVAVLDASGNPVSSATSEDGTYSFSDLPDGTYTVQISRAKCAPRSLAVTVDGTPVSLDVELRLYGDVDGDGKIEASDATQILKYENELPSVFDSDEELKKYLLSVGNVLGGGISPQDATQILKHEAGLPSAFDNIS